MNVLKDIEETPLNEEESVKRLPMPEKKHLVRTICPSLPGAAVN